MTNNIESDFIQTHLNNLKHRLDYLSNACTIDNYEALLKFYVNILPKIINAERCTIFINEIGSNQISSIFGTGIINNQIKPPKKGSIAGEAISSGKSIIQNNLNQQKGFHTKVDNQTGFTTKNIICVPIKSLTGYGITGAVEVLNKIGDNLFTESDLNLLEEVSSYLSISIESFILNQEILRISSQLNKEVERFHDKYFLDTLFIAQSPAMKEVINLVNLVSSTPINVLVCGENGTGKELIARMIHSKSIRKDNPFVAVNCSTIPETLMESEFFGYEKGAFTGADRKRIGCFEEADSGTLLLDEISDMPLIIQPKFLRAIQEGECRRLGGNKVVKFDVRIISTSNKDLKKELQNGKFREDLYFRLFSVEIFIPPLRERKEDIIPISIAFLEDITKRFNKKISGFSIEVLNLFEAYRWPGNVRQLRREIERLVTLTPGNSKILPDKLSKEIQIEAKNNKNDFNYSIPKHVKEIEITLIQDALKLVKGNRENAAKLLGITRQGLYKKMKRYAIETY